MGRDQLIVDAPGDEWLKQRPSACRHFLTLRKDVMNCRQELPFNRHHPLPIGERRNGICVRSINARTGSPASHGLLEPVSPQLIPLSKRPEPAAVRQL